MRALAVLSFLAATAAQAAPVLWVGHLENNGVPVEGTVALSATFSDGNGDDAAAALIEPAQVVVGGDFVLELDISSSVTRPVTMEIIINGQDFGDDFSLLLDWPDAAVANDADHADSAAVADAIDGVSPISDVDLAAGLFPIDVSNVAGFPSEFLDGDQGIDLTGSGRIAINGGLISIVDASIDASRQSGTLSNSDLAVGAVGTADLTNNSLDDVDISSVPLTAIADHTLRAGHFSAAQDRTTIFQITNPFCANVGTLTAGATCAALDTCPNGIERRDCNGTCATLVNATCSNTVIGDLVFN